MVTRGSHKPLIEGSTPFPATKEKMLIWIEHYSINYLEVVRLTKSSPNCRYSTVVSAPVFQTGDISSNLITCSKYKVMCNLKEGDELCSHRLCG